MANRTKNGGRTNRLELAMEKLMMYTKEHTEHSRHLKEHTEELKQLNINQHIQVMASFASHKDVYLKVIKYLAIGLMIVGGGKGVISVLPLLLGMG